MAAATVVVVSARDGRLIGLAPRRAEVVHAIVAERDGRSGLSIGMGPRELGCAASDTKV